MTDMVSWLRSSLTELERVARQATEKDHPEWVMRLLAVDALGPRPRRPHRPGVNPKLRSERPVVIESDDGGGAVTDDVAAHIALHDPRSVLARVEAEKALLALHRPDRDTSMPGEPMCVPCKDTVEWGGDSEGEWPCDTLRWLAYGHRYDSDGFDCSWAPEGVETPS